MYGRLDIRFHISYDPRMTDLDLSEHDDYYPTPNSFTLQSNWISRAAYRLPVMSRRLIFIATAAVQAQDPEGEMWAELQVGEVVQALGLSGGGKNYRAVREAVQNLANQSIMIEKENNDWTVHQWIYSANYSSKTDTIRIRIGDEIRPYILQLKDRFSRLRLAAFGKLQTRHSQRLYEIIMSAAGFAGKRGNPPNTWWIRLEKDRLRKLLVIKDNEYKTTADLRRRVVDDPIREINAADIGLHVKVEYEKKGRSLVAFTFTARHVEENEPRDITPSKADLDDRRLIELNQDIWDEEFERATKQGTLFATATAEADAWESFIKRNDLVRE